MAIAVSGLYLVVAAVRVFMFMEQRVALAVCRAGDLPRDFKAQLLPGWFGTVVWPVLILRILLLLAIALTATWWLAVLLWLAEAAVTTFVPIPTGILLSRILWRLANRVDLDSETREAFIDYVRAAGNSPRFIREV